MQNIPTILRLTMTISENDYTLGKDVDIIEREQKGGRESGRERGEREREKVKICPIYLYNINLRLLLNLK